MLDPPVVAFGLPEPRLFRPPQDAADELGRLVARETRGQLYRLVHGYLGGYVLDVEHLVEREAQDRAVHGAHPIHWPADRDLTEPFVEDFLLSLDLVCGLLSVGVKFTDVGVQRPQILPPAFKDLVHGLPDDVALVKREKGVLASRAPAAQGSLNPRQVLFGTRVHPHPLTDVHEERYLHHEPGLQSRGLGAAGRRVAFEPRICLRYLKIHVYRRLDAYHLPIGEEDTCLAVRHDVIHCLAQDLGGDGNLLIGLRIHKVVKIPIPIQERHRPRLGPYALDLLAGPKGLLHDRPRVYVPQARPDKGPALARFYVLEVQNGEALAIHPDGRTVPKLIGRDHARDYSSKDTKLAQKCRNIIAQIPPDPTDLRRRPSRPRPGALLGFAALPVPWQFVPYIEPLCIEPL